MGGMALLQTMRQKGWEMPVILMTGHPLDVTLPELQAQGRCITLTKPISPAPLAQAVASALDQG
jgi:DNA-binding NtrC family response regulator